MVELVVDFICIFLLQIWACFFENNYLLFGGKKQCLEEIGLFWAKQLFIFLIRWRIF